MSDLAEFLLARIAEAEQSVRDLYDMGDLPTDLGYQILTDFDVKRQIIVDYQAGEVPVGVVECLAMVYAQHPDYDTAWIPEGDGEFW